jgi:hypothetical protein
MRKPNAKWVRIATGILFIIGSCLSILPIFGIWMLPLGMILLAQDIPLFQRLCSRLLDWVERRHPMTRSRRRTGSFAVVLFGAAIDPLSAPNIDPRHCCLTF